MPEKDFIKKLQPQNVSDTDWNKIVQTLVSEGARQEKEFYRKDTTSLYGMPSGDPMYDVYEAAQAPVFINDRHLDAQLEKEKVNETQKTLVLEGSTASGSYIRGWDTAITFSRTQSVGNLFLQQDAAFYRSYADPHGSALVNNFINFVVGTGIKVVSGSPEVHNHIQEFRRINKMSLTDRNIIRGLYVDGEYFLIFYPVGKGDLLVRRAPAREIEEVETDPEDKDTVIAYKRTWVDEKNKMTSLWYPDIFYVERRNKGHVNPSKNIRYARDYGTKLIQYFKWGNDEEIRGRVPMYPVLRFMKYHEDWLVDRIRLNHERSKATWIRTLSDVGGTASSYTSTNPMTAPRGGLILTETPGITYRIISAQIQADDVKEDGLAIQYAISAGTQFPLYVLTQRIDEQIFSAIKKADTPFSMMIESWQDLTREYMRDTYYVVVREAVNSGVLPSKTKVPAYLLDDEVVDEAVNMINEMILDKKDEKDIIKEAQKVLNKNGKDKTKEVNTVDAPIGIHFPPVVKDSALDIAKVLNIYSILGIASKDTLATMAGFDWKKEQLKIRMERSTGMDTGSQQKGTYPPDSKGPTRPGDTTIDGGRDNADKE